MAIELGIDLSEFAPDPGPKALLAYRKAVTMLRPPFTTLWFNDHLQWGGDPTFEGWTMLTYLAAEFPQYKIGHLVLCQGFRNPAHLAKMAASLQLLSGGRFIMGIGAGWNKEEQDAFGYDFPSPGVRVAQLGETLAIMRAMWTESPATYHGRHYHIENAYCEPKPDPMIPILVGTGGRKALRLAAQYADMWNANAPLANLAPPCEILRQHCADLGRDMREIAITCFAKAHFPTDPAEFIPNQGTDPLKLGPTPADALAQLQPLIDFGVSHIMVRFGDFATIERFCAEVAPALASLPTTAG